ELDYLSQMPGEYLREIHITGIASDESGARYDHMGLAEQDWPFVEWVLDRVRAGDWSAPWIAGFEYGGIGPHFEWRSDSSVIGDQVPRLYELVHSF
ncbi:MAG TPA: hypothetical protein VHP83_11685, partial [Aggregatilineaceae bacterium]|nr:hypothetical protein [Aggregatilineaceae bacterium]